MSDNDIAVLPEGWSAIPLGMLVRPSKVKVEPSEMPDAPYLSLEHIESGTGKIIGRGVGADVASTKAVFKAGDVLYGKLRPYLNKVCIPDFDGICSTDILVFEPSPAVESSLLRHFLSLPENVEYANHHSAGVQLPRVSFTALAELIVRLPPVDEQRRIVASVNALLARVNVVRERLARVPLILKRFRQAIFTVAFNGQLTSDWRGSVEAPNSADELAAIRRESLPPDEERTHEIPDLWQWTTLGECFEVGVGGTPSRKMDAYWNGHIPRVSSGEVRFTRIAKTRETITDEGLANSNAKLNPAGTVLLGMIGEGKTRGQAAILDIDACNNQNAAAIRVSDTSVPSEFVFYWLWSQYESTRERGAGNSQPALNKERVKIIPLPFPPLAEQHEIVRRVDELFTLADAVERRVSAATVRADKLTQAILAKAFRGELVPTEAELARIEGRQYESADQMLVRVAATKTEPVKATRKPRVIHKTVEHIIDIRQDVSMRTLNKTSVMAAVAKMKTAEFTFDDLRKAFPGDYEGLKQTVFDLLQEPNSELTQRFDEMTEQMKLVRRQK